ncbi:MAG: PH domain-containing protein [Candidatus Hodarchaeota archaeon]
MGRDYEGKVIKPPIGAIGYGKVFKPSTALRNKYWVIVIVSVVFFYIISLGAFFGVYYFILSFTQDLWQYQAWIMALWMPVNLWFWTIALVFILIPAFIIIPVYLNRFEYSVRGESGESLPEVYVKKGLIDITEKHVPLRTITNISSRTGPFDRLFGIGSVEIYTAGQSGGPYDPGKPEEKIEGIVFYHELRDFILSEMRRLKGAYATTTEIPLQEVSSLEELTLKTLQEMRDLLRDINDKLDRRNP